MEAEKSHGLPSAGWGPRKAGGEARDIVQSEPKGLRTRSTAGRRWPFQLKQSGRKN